MKVSIRQVFGFDSDMEVFLPEPDEHVPDVDLTTTSQTTLAILVVKNWRTLSLVIRHR